jgi:hypothetical protein
MYRQLSSYLNRYNNVDIGTVETQPIDYFAEDNEKSQRQLSFLEENQDELEPLKEIKKPPESLPSVTDGDEQGTEIKSYQEAIALIKELRKQGENYANIAKVLTGKYLTATGKTNWSGTQVNRIVNK